MYSTKEKMKLLRELHNPEFAEADLALAKKLNPQSDLTNIPEQNVKRSSEKILYSLLDMTTSENIRLNRRGSSINEGKVYYARFTNKESLGRGSSITEGKEEKTPKKKESKEKKTAIIAKQKSNPEGKTSDENLKVPEKPDSKKS